FHAMTDRVATTATAWLGLTLGCAQCHTHKFDPVTHKEYYQFFAFFNNADEPEMAVPRPDIARRRQEIEKQIAARLAALPDVLPREQREKKFNDWLKSEAEKATRWTVLKPVAAKANLPLLTVLPDHSILASGDQSKSDTYEVKLHTDLAGVTAFRLEV